MGHVICSPVHTTKLTHKQPDHSALTVTGEKPNADHERSPWRKTKPKMMAAGSSGRLKEKTNLSDCWEGGQFLTAKEHIGPGPKATRAQQQSGFRSSMLLRSSRRRKQTHNSMQWRPLTEGGTGKTKSRVNNCRPACWRSPLLGDWKKPQQDALRERPLSGPTHVCTAVN